MHSCQVMSYVYSIIPASPWLSAVSPWQGCCALCTAAFLHDTCCVQHQLVRSDVRCVRHGFCEVHQHCTVQPASLPLHPQCTSSWLHPGAVALHAEYGPAGAKQLPMDHSRLHQACESLRWRLGFIIHKYCGSFTGVVGYGGFTSSSVACRRSAAGCSASCALLHRQLHSWVLFCASLRLSYVLLAAVTE
jgi:hypothetical protein